MLRQVVGWSAAALALIALFGVQVASQVLGLSFGILLVAAIGVAVGLAAELHGRLHPGFGRLTGSYGLTLWVLPAALVWAVGLSIVLWHPEDVLLARGLPLVGAALAGLAVFLQDRELSRGDEDSSVWPRQTLSLLTYVGGFGLFALIYGVNERGILSIVVSAAVAALLSVVLLRGTGAPLKRVLFYVGLSAVAAGEVTWALNYWIVRDLIAGAVLLLLFYVVVGLAEIVLRGEMTRRLLAEYVAVGIVGFLFILSTAPWRP
ncbi:MAG: hypothetical protein IT305_16040 [Chloroflexi bacterium]|nr:hypothetical protein [Chloroflexota bacterium]